MKSSATLLILSLSLLFFSCQAQSPVLSYGEFMNLIERKEADKVIFHKNSKTVTIIKDGKEDLFEYNLDDVEGKDVTRALTKAKIIYKSDEK